YYSYGDEQFPGSKRHGKSSPHVGKLGSICRSLPSVDREDVLCRSGTFAFYHTSSASLKWSPTLTITIPIADDSVKTDFPAQSSLLVEIPLDNCQSITILDPGDPLTVTSAIVRVRLDFADSILGKGPPSQITCYVQSQDPDNPVQQVVTSCPKSRTPPKNILNIVYDKYL
ncbi:hypothetical protein STEG23_033747, partial [Scotinomys teguina]